MVTRMLTEFRPAFSITVREVRDQFRDWRIIFPILALTLFFPFLMNFTARRLLDFVNQYGASLIGERLVPFLMMIVGFFPISVSLVIALETFVGEKERGSIEPLLCTPLKDWQLYVGKLLSATVPPLLGSFLGMTVYMAGLVARDVPLPPPDLTLLIFSLTSVQAVVMVSAAVVISTQATSIRSANLLASFIIIPIALLIQAESVVMFWGNYATLWWTVLGLFIFAILLVRVGLAHFKREELLGREIDVLNIRWAWSVFVKKFKGDAKNILQWYGKEIPKSLKRLRVPALLTSIIAIIAVFLGMELIKSFQIPIGETNLKGMTENIYSALQSIPGGSLAVVLSIFWQNFRVVLVAFFLGAISFGIFGMIPLVASMGMVGYLLSLLSANGLPPAQYLVGFILPHGIFEIPALIIGCAAVLRGGALLATTDENRNIGEAFFESVSEWCKLTVAVVIPLLLIAACVEVWLTPKIAMMLIPLIP
jgi:uncharacterized membrane protein SpoIIM required for sporulation